MPSPASDSPRRDHIADIIALIEKLAARGIAYRATDGSVYFSIEKYQAAGGNYGQLLKLNFDEMRPGQRVASDEYAKDAVADFALWKARVPSDGAVFWPSPWGDGLDPAGQHVECSAMSMKALGPSFDVHLGGEDLVFPHHEDEIAQSEGAAAQAPGQRFVKYWLHGAHLLVEGRKMSKSLGNFLTVRDLLAQGFSGREIRYALLQAHYRESFNFTLEGLRGGRTALARLDECLGKLREAAGSVTAPADPVLMEQFSTMMDEDLNVSAAWGAIFEWVREEQPPAGCGPVRNETAEAAAGLAAWNSMDLVLGITKLEESAAPAALQKLLEQRDAARKARDFQRAASRRGEFKAQGWAIEDTAKGARLKRL